MSSTTNSRTIVEQALRTADPVCLACSALYTELRLLIEESVVIWSRGAFLNDAISTELDSINELKASIEHYLQTSVSECVSSIKSLQTSQSKLHALLTELKSVELDASLVTEGEKPADLSFFIHTESIEAIDTRIGTLLLELNARRSELSNTAINLNAKLTELYKLRPEFPAVIANETPRRLAKVRQKATAAATEATNTLISLTLQYDELNANKETQEEANANQEVSRQLQSLTRAHEELKLRNRESMKIQRSLALTFAEIVHYSTKTAQFIPQNVEIVLNEIELNGDSKTELFTSFETVFNETNSLTQYYRMFKQSYSALLKELKRRKESEHRLDQFVEKVNQSLATFYATEIDARTQFMDKHGAYLPSELGKQLAGAPLKLSIPTTH